YRQIRAQCRVREGRPTRFSVRRTHLQCVDEADVPERLLVHDPRGTHFWVRDPLELRAEGAVVVHPEGAGEIQPLVETELLLCVATYGRVDGVALRGRERGCGAGNRRDRRTRKSDSA